MFPFDSNVLPQLPTRKGLMVIDFQNDFLAADGALTVNDPDDLVSRTLDLVKDFRKVGDIIWVCTKFDKLRAASLDQILATDAAPKPTMLASRPRPRRGPAAKNHPKPDDGADADVDADADPEAFLGPCGPPSVRPATPGVQFPVAVKDSVGPRDLTFIKSDYSAFKSGRLLQMLRVKFVTELYMCGSLANVGVYATAMDAARYGYSITLVEDCCGYRSELRHGHAIQGLIDVTGCTVTDSEAVVENLKPKTVPPSQPSSPVPPVVPRRVADTSGDVSGTELLEKQVAALKLSSGSSSSAAATREAPVRPPDPECDTISDNLEVDPELQPPPLQAATGSDSHHNGVGVIPKEAEESSTDTERKKPLKSQPVATATTEEKDTMEKPQIIEVAAIDETSHTSGSEPGPELISAPKESQEELQQQPQEKLQETQKESPEESPETQEEPQEEPQAGKSDQTPAEAEQIMPHTTEALCEGDTTVIHNLLPQPLAEGIFEAVRDEVSWQRMSHQGGEVPRLVAVQGEVASDGSMPVYRHPADESPPLLPFSSTVLKIKAEVEKHLGHTLNHALIQFYRDGTDYISEHSDKTLDIVKGSYIANVSLGAERTMVLRTKRRAKDPSSGPTPPTQPSSSSSSSSLSSSPPSQEDTKPRRISRAKLPHNSLCRMGLETNMRWLHAIRQDKRMERDKTPAELAYSCGRISLTFRRIGTFLDRDGALIWGQGATGKTREEARPVVNGQGPEAVEMLRAFGTENHSSAFDWATHYGSGFDVLHINNAPRLCASADPVVNMRIALMLAEYGVSYAKGSMSPPFNCKDGQDGAKDTPAAAAVVVPETLPIRFVDNDAAKSTVEGELAIMLYLDAVYGSGKTAGTRPPSAELAAILTRFQRGLALLDKWRRLVRDNDDDDDQGKRDLKPLRRELAVWDRYAAEAEFIAGPGISLADFAVWPALHAVVTESAGGGGGVDSLSSASKHLKAYYERFKARTSTAKVLSAGRPAGGAEDDDAKE